MLRTDGKRPDGVTLLSWKHGKCLAWDVTMPDTFAASHLPTTALNHGSAAESSATLKTQKYANIAQTHIFTSVAIETSGILSIQARELLRTRKKNIRDHRRNESNYLPLPASVSCNTTWTHALFHGVFRHQRRLMFTYK